MYRIAKQFHFSASHQLTNLPHSHPCARLHGHNYEVEVELASAELDAFGFVRDYTDLDILKKHIDDRYDHQHLNDVMGTENTTAEVIARTIYDWCKLRWPEVCAVTVRETPRSWAEYRPGC